MSSWKEWAKDPQGGGSGWRVRIRYELQGHDQECRSLSEAWLPRVGGVACPSDLFDCSDCGTMFFNEGCYGEDDNEDGWYMYCDCCARRLGREYNLIEASVDAHGIPIPAVMQVIIDKYAPKEE